MAKLNLTPPPNDNNKPPPQVGSGKSRIEAHKKKRTKTKVKHAVGGVWSTLMTILGLAILVSALYGLYYLWQNKDNLTPDSIIPAGDLVIMHKETIPGYTIDKPREESQPSKEFSEWVSPRHLIVVQSSITKLTYYYELPERQFQQLSLGQKVPKDENSGWRRLSESEYALAQKRILKTESE